MTDESHFPTFIDFCSQCLEGSYGPLFQTFGIVLFVLIFNFALKVLLTKFGKRFSNQKRIWAVSMVTALQKPLTYYVWFVAVLCSLDIIARTLFKFHLSNFHTILSVGAVLAFGWFLHRLNREVVHHMMEMSQNHRIPITPVKLDLFSKLVTISVFFITIFLLLDVTGRNMQTLIAFGGIGGLALAFASQQVVSNFFGGFMVYLTRPFTIGEWVNLPERQIEGHIEEIGWYLTRIRNFEKRPIYVPNSVFTQTIVMTPSRMSHERFHPTIGLRYKDIQVIQPIIHKIKQMLLSHRQIDHRLPLEVFFTRFGAASLDIEISAYVTMSIETPYPVLRQELLLAIASIVSEEGAEIAMPTNIVEIRGDVKMETPKEAYDAPQTLSEIQQKQSH